MESQRLEISRLFARFNFGPVPGQFSQALQEGFKNTATKILNVSEGDPRLDLLLPPTLTDLGPRPSQSNKAASEKFTQDLKAQGVALIFWWLDRMALAKNPLIERMVWFWHGHWATSLDKVNFPLPMFKQNETLRRNALGNFRTMSHEMFHDGALQIWLDGNDNIKGAPNENLSREFMELFTLGVNMYTEDDVKAIARAFTGYQTVRSAGEVIFNPKRHDFDPIKVFGVNSPLDGDGAIDLILSKSECADFISDRLWYRLISSSLPRDAKIVAAQTFSQREVAPVINALVLNGALSDPRYSVVRQPVEWFIAVCRAFSLQPSKLSNRNFILGALQKMAQLPFYPPNVGGWPTDEAWLSSASAQFRISFATGLSKQIDFTALGAIAPEQRVAYIKDLLGILEFSPRTFTALTNAKSDLPQFFTLAVCSPEFVVNA